MVREIVTNDIDGMKILTQRSEKVAKCDDIKNVIRDLIDTAQFHSEKCLGLSAIQIGVPKRICVIMNGKDNWLTFINPVIVSRSTSAHMSTEGCLSVEGEQTVKRWDKVTIMHESSGKMKKLTLGKIHAVIIQHELDHMNGILI